MGVTSGVVETVREMVAERDGVTSDAAARAVTPSAASIVVAAGADGFVATSRLIGVRVATAVRATVASVLAAFVFCEFDVGRLRDGVTAAANSPDAHNVIKNKQVATFFIMDKLYHNLPAWER